MTRILLIGSNGQVGWELQRALAPLGQVIAADRQMMDISSPDSIVSALREFKPGLIVNAAAYTAVDKAESEPELALMVNGTAPGILAEEARRLNAALVHYSTDYVFDGTRDGAYTERDAPNPLSVYGKTKRVGEEAVQAAGVPHLILRTSWVYGTRGRNFLNTMLRLAREREVLKVVDDQIGAPTWSRMIAEATAQILAQLKLPVVSTKSSLAENMSEVGGLYHLTAGGQTSWHGFTRAILSNMAQSPLPQLIPIPASDYPLPAPRPANSVMSNAKLEETFGLALPDWEASLRMCMAESAGAAA